MKARGKARSASPPLVDRIKASVALLRNYDGSRLTYHQFVTKFARGAV
jgi:hypothetical protein